MLEPSNGGMGNKLIAANMMFIQMPALDIKASQDVVMDSSLSVFVKKPSSDGIEGRVRMKIIPQIMAIIMFDNGPAADTKAKSLLGFLSDSESLELVSPSQK